MSLEWFLAHSFESVDATLTNPTSEQGPDGLAVNALTFDNSTWGPPWVGGSGEANLQADITTDDALDPSTLVFWARGNMPDNDATVIRFYDGTIANPGRAPLQLGLTKVAPANLWVGFATSTSPVTAWSVDIATDGSVDPLNVKLGFATRRQIIGGAQPLSVGRPEHTRTATDLSTQTDGQTGAVFSARQVRKARLAVPFVSHEDTVGLHVIHRAWDRAGITEPVLVCLDKDTFDTRGRTVLGLFQGELAEQIAAGMISSGGLTVVEMLG